jgi:sulfofructose kinase
VNTSKKDIDVLCVGHASYDLTFVVDHHPGDDEKVHALDFTGCGGGPAATAAVAAARLGLRSAFAGYLGNDLYGRQHAEELNQANVDTEWLARGDAPTPLSAVFVSPGGRRALVNYRGKTPPLEHGAIDFSPMRPKVILFDGLQPRLSLPLAESARRSAVYTLLDAGSVHEGTAALAERVDYLIASEKFASEFTGQSDLNLALARLAGISPVALITIGSRGLLWKCGPTHGRMTAFPVAAVDTTGAGDVFHGAFAAGIAEGKEWEWVLRFASAAAALTCTRAGARFGIPDRKAVCDFMDAHPSAAHNETI